MVSIEIELEGATEAASRLDSLANSITREIASALQEAANIFVQNAQANAPVDTGFMRDNITITESSDTSITITSEAGYSGFVEYGTRKMDSQPFFEPAIEQSISEIEQLISDAISPDNI
jgi:HK97 gp10 family phage protein